MKRGDAYRSIRLPEQAAGDAGFARDKLARVMCEAMYSTKRHTLCSNARTLDSDAFKRS